MKTVFKIAPLLALLGAAPAARADVYWSPRELLADPSFFRASEQVGYRQFDLTAEQRARIEQRLGYRLAKSRWTIFVATTGARVDGYALFDEELGEHQRSEGHTSELQAPVHVVSPLSLAKMNTCMSTEAST